MRSSVRLGTLSVMRPSFGNGSVVVVKASQGLLDSTQLMLGVASEGSRQRRNSASLASIQQKTVIPLTSERDSGNTHRSCTNLSAAIVTAMMTELALLLILWGSRSNEA